MTLAAPQPHDLRTFSVPDYMGTVAQLEGLRMAAREAVAAWSGASVGEFTEAMDLLRAVLDRQTRKAVAA